MYIMKLGTDMEDCPVEWENFIRAVWDLTPDRDDNGIPDSTINEFLKPYNAIYYENLQYDITLTFQHEEDYILYKLKYGGLRNSIPY